MVNHLVIAMHNYEGHKRIFKLTVPQPLFFFTWNITLLCLILWQQFLAACRAENVSRRMISCPMQCAHDDIIV